MATFYPNVIYKTTADGTELGADIYAPVPKPGMREKCSPALFWIHGGGWVQGDRNQILPLKRFMRTLRSNGITLVTFSYR